MTKDDDLSNGQRQASSDEHSRRGFLKGAAATGTAVAGMGAASAPASAQLFGGGGGLFGGGIETFDVGSASQLPNRDAEELLVWLHGLGGSSTTGFQAGRFQSTLENAGYGGTVIAGSYNSFGGFSGFFGGASSDAEAMARLVEDYYDTTGGSLRIVGHSMGGFLTYQTLSALDDSYSVDTAATVGTGAPANMVCENGQYGDAIANNAGAVRIYISDNDSILSSFGGDSIDCSSGFMGGGSQPGNLEVVDVTQDVSNHITYWGSDMVAQDLVSTFDQAGGGSSDGGSSDGDSSGGGPSDGNSSDRGFTDGGGIFGGDSGGDSGLFGGRSRDSSGFTDGGGGSGFTGGFF